MKMRIQPRSAGYLGNLWWHAVHVDYAKALAKRLLEEVNAYFDKNMVLNSEGRKVLERLLRQVLRTHPELKSVAKEVRREPTYERVAKLLTMVLGEETLRTSQRYYGAP